MFALLEAAGESQNVAVGTSTGGLMAMRKTKRRKVFTHVALNDIGPELEGGFDRISSYVGRAALSLRGTRRSAQPQYQCRFPTLSDDQWETFTRQSFSERDGAPYLDYDPAISQAVKADDGSAVPLDLWPVYQLLDAQPLG